MLLRVLLVCCRRSGQYLDAPLQCSVNYEPGKQIFNRYYCIVINPKRYIFDPAAVTVLLRSALVLDIGNTIGLSDTLIFGLSALLYNKDLRIFGAQSSALLDRGSISM